MFNSKNIIQINKDLNESSITKENLVKNALINAHDDDCNSLNLIIDNPDTFDNKESLLNGIPYVLKDNISTKDIRTTACSNTLKNYVPVFSATIYEKLQQAGAVLIGKANMDELALGGTGITGNTGVILNPWNKKHICGGSSSGSACAVAKGIVPFAIGSDTGDSIRKPAAYTGTVGYKPSYGLVSRYGLFAFASSLDHLGVFTQSVKDAAIVINEVKGYDPKDMTSISDMDEISLVDNINNDVKGKKLFYIKELCNPDNYPLEMNKKIISDFQDAINKIRNIGISIEEVSIDMNLLKAIKPVYDCLSCAEATSNDSNLTGIIFGPRGEGNNVTDVMKDHRTKGFSSLIKRRFVIGSYVLSKENQEKYFVNAMRVRRLIVEKFNELFKKYDGLIMPCSCKVAPLVKDASDHIGDSNNIETIMENHLAIGNFGGYPSITIPYGLYDGLPLGLNITGAFKDDSNVLNIANKIEAVLDFKSLHAKEDK